MSARLSGPTCPRVSTAATATWCECPPLNLTVKLRAWVCPDDRAVADHAVAGERGIARLGLRQPMRTPVAVLARTRSPGTRPGGRSASAAVDLRGTDLRRLRVARLDREHRASPEHYGEHHRGPRRLPHGAPRAQHAVARGRRRPARRAPAQAHVRSVQSRRRTALGAWRVQPARAAPGVLEAPEVLDTPEVLAAARAGGVGDGSALTGSPRASGLGSPGAG